MITLDDKTKSLFIILPLALFTIIFNVLLYHTPAIIVSIYTGILLGLFILSLILFKGNIIESFKFYKYILSLYYTEKYRALSKLVIAFSFSPFVYCIYITVNYLV